MGPPRRELPRTKTSMLNASPNNQKPRQAVLTWLVSVHSTRSTLMRTDCHSQWPWPWPAETAAEPSTGSTAEGQDRHR